MQISSIENHSLGLLVVFVCPSKLLFQFRFLIKTVFNSNLTIREVESQRH